MTVRPLISPGPPRPPSDALDGDGPVGAARRSKFCDVGGEDHAAAIFDGQGDSVSVDDVGRAQRRLR